MLAFSAIVFAAATISAAFAGQLSFQSGDVLVEWTYLPGTQEIEFNLTVKTTGWVGLGISTKNDGMKKLDLYAGGFKNSASYLEDYYVDAKTTPTVDTTNDATIISASESGGTTNIRFKRKLDTGDAKDNKITPGENMYLAWAYGSTDTFGYHAANKDYSGLVTLVAAPASSTIAPTASSSVVATSSVAPASPTPTPTSASQDKELMFKNGEYKLNWNFNSNAKEVMFKITVTGTGWIGVGISDSNKGMKDLDIAVAMVNSSGHGTVEDYYSTSETTPAKDAKQDFTFIKASQDNGKTIVEFKRQLKTNDEKDVEIMVGKTYYIAWAFSPTSLVFKYHNSNRGYSSNKVVLAGTQTTTVAPTSTAACAKLSSILVLSSVFVAMFGC